VTLTPRIGVNLTGSPVPPDRCDFDPDPAGGGDRRPAPLRCPPFPPTNRPRYGFTPRRR